MQINPIELNLQWHITTNCSNRCNHCYMYDSKTFNEERKNTLSLADLFKTLESLNQFEKKYNTNFRFSFSGGDPLMRNDFHHFFKEVKKQGKKFSLMGNPETLNDENIKKLKELEIRHFQMSLDGLEKLHDSFRAKGSFQRTVDKLTILKKNKIRTNIMFTLFPSNANELIPLMNFVAKYTTTTSFSFDIGCFVGCGSNLNKDFSKEKLYDILSKYIIEKEKLQKDYEIHFHEKSNLLKLIRFSNNTFYPTFSRKTPVISGCLNGWSPPSILSDGTCLICRRMPIKIGEMPQQSFEDIFLGNVLLKKFRRKSFFIGCATCDFYSVCRGCPAMVYSLTGNPFEKNPFCFRNLINKKTKENSIFKDLDLNTSYKKEWDLISKRILFLRDYEKHLENIDFAYLYIDLFQDSYLRKVFLKQPYKFIKNKKFHLDADEISFLINRFAENFNSKIADSKNDLILTASLNKIFKGFEALQ